MKRIIEEEINSERKSSVLSMWQNQHPLMFLWFALMSISMCFVYVLLFTTF